MHITTAQDTDVKVEFLETYNDNNNQEQMVNVVINGIKGKIELCSNGQVSSLHGKFASSTGYRSSPGQFNKEKNEDLKGFLKEHYTKNAKYPFVIGEEHKDFGWKSISTYNNRIEIRLPNWHEGDVQKMVEKMGFSLTDEINNKWSISCEKTTIKEAKLALKPILEKNTRYANEETLANKLLKSGEENGLINTQIQDSLF